MADGRPDGTVRNTGRFTELAAGVKNRADMELVIDRIIELLPLLEGNDHFHSVFDKAIATFLRWGWTSTPAAG